MKERKTVIAAVLVFATLIVCLTLLIQYRAYNSQLKKTGKIDLYSMQVGSIENGEKLFDALENETADLEILFKETYDRIDDSMKNEIENLGAYTDWGECDFDNIRNMGGGFVGDSEKEYWGDEKLYYENYWVLESSQQSYVIYLQCAYEAWGRENKGIWAVAVTSWDNYYNRDDFWDYKTDDETIRIGELQ